MSIAVVMPVGGGAEEFERCCDTVASIASWEPAVRWLVLVDDSPESRAFGRPDIATDIATVVLPNPLRGQAAPVEDRVTAATLAGLGWVFRETDAEFVMKIDTDALVIAPFADKLARATADPSIGLVGSYDRTCNGEPRSFDPWIELVQQAGRLFGPGPRLALGGRRGKVRRIVREARAAGYVWGEHALGCAIAIPRRALDEIARAGALDDPELFRGTRLFDDPVLGLLVRRGGLRLAGDVEAGQTFGVAWRGLPDTPQRLRHRGYSIIHSVKNDPRLSEADIRGQFAGERRPAASSGR